MLFGSKRKFHVRTGRMEKNRTAAFFDIDGTIVSCMTQGVFISLLRERKMVKTRQLVFAGIWYYLYNRGMVENSAPVRRSLYSLLKPHPKAAIDRLLEEAAGLIREKVRHELRLAVDEHKRRGDLLFAITGSIRELCVPLCADLGIEHLYAMRLHAENDKYTAGWEGTLYEGKYKSRLMDELAREHGIDLSRSAAYADSFADVPMLEAVGTAAVVYPDPRLLKHAVKRGWRVIGAR